MTTNSSPVCLFLDGEIELIRCPNSDKHDRAIFDTNKIWARTLEHYVKNEFPHLQIYIEVVPTDSDCENDHNHSLLVLVFPMESHSRYRIPNHFLLGNKSMSKATVEFEQTLPRTGVRLEGFQLRGHNQLVFRQSDSQWDINSIYTVAHGVLEMNNTVKSHSAWHSNLESCIP